jgi:LPS export ABC transporter protein LptC
MNKILRKHWPLVIMGFLFAAVMLYLFHAPKAPTAQSAAQAEESEEGVRLNDVHYVQDDPVHNVKWVLDASEAKLSKDQQIVTFVNFHVTLEPKDQPWVTMQGKEGQYDKRTGRLVLQGDLKGETEDGYRFATEQAVYHHKEGYLESDRMVKISGDFFSVEGKGLFLDMGKEKLQILSDVTTRIHGEPPAL